MQITPQAPVTPTQDAASSARDRAIATLTQANPVPNPTSVSPEEMGAISKTPQQAETDGNSTLGEEPKAEAPAEKKDPLSTQYAKLARQEKVLRAKAQEIRQRELALKTKEQSLQTPTPVDTSKYIARDRLKSELLTVLAEEGVSYDELANSLLSQTQTPQDPVMKAAIQKLEQQLKLQQEELQKSKNLQEESQKQQYNQAVAQIRSDVRSLVQSDPSFETVRETNSINDVVELIERTFNEEKRLMTIDEAAQAVEDYLVDETMKLVKLSKIRSKLNPPARTSAPQQAGESKQPQSKTLTNTMSSSKPLSARERAVLAMQGKLK